VFVETLTARDIELQNGRITAETLRGTFRGKPRGSVEPRTSRASGPTSTASASGGGALQGDAGLRAGASEPEVMQSVLEQVLRVYRIPDRQVWLEAVKQSLLAMQQAQTMRMLLPQMGAGGPAPMGAPMPGRAPCYRGRGAFPLVAQIPPTGPMQSPQQAALQRGPDWDDADDPRLSHAGYRDAPRVAACVG